MTGWGIVENLLSDLILIGIAIISSWLWISLTHRRKLQQFFGTLNTKRLFIYLSDINVLPFGAIGKSGRKLSYQGHAVAYGEMQGASQIKNLFSFIIPKLAEASQTIGKIFLSDVVVQTTISPQETKDLDSQASFIALGSGAYNPAAAYIEGLGNGIVKFQFGSMKLSELVSDRPQHAPTVFSSTDQESYTIPGAINMDLHQIPVTIPGTVDLSQMPPVVPSGVHQSNPTGFSYLSELLHNLADAKDSENDKPSAILIDGLPPITDTTYGFVERVMDSEVNRAFFYIAGLSEFSTTAASYYLASQWLALYKKYKGSKSFIIMLRFDSQDFKKWTVIFERDLS